MYTAKTPSEKIQVSASEQLQDICLLDLLNTGIKVHIYLCDKECFIVKSAGIVLTKAMKAI